MDREQYPGQDAKEIRRLVQDGRLPEEKSPWSFPPNPTAHIH